MLDLKPSFVPLFNRILFITSIIAAIVLVLATLWAGDSAGSFRNLRWRRPVVLDGRELGYVNLRPLEKQNGLWSLNVFFEPVNDDLRIVRENSLHWWQIVDRPNLPGYPRMDLQSGTELPGSPGDDDDPAYYTREEKLGLGGYFSPGEIYADNKYWLRDSPEPAGGATFEAWLVAQGDSTLIRMIGFRWGFSAYQGTVWKIYEPEYIDQSAYDVEEILQSSGFGDKWTDLTVE